MAEVSAIDAAIEFIRTHGMRRTPEISARLGIGEPAVEAMLEPACAQGRLVSCDLLSGGRWIKEYRLSLNGGGKLQQFIPLHRSGRPAPGAAHSDTTHGPVASTTQQAGSVVEGTKPAGSGADANDGSNPSGSATSTAAALTQRQRNGVLLQGASTVTPASAAAATTTRGSPATNNELADQASTGRDPRSTSTRDSHMAFRERVEAMLRKTGPMTMEQLRSHGLKDEYAPTLVSQLAKRGVLAKLGGGPRSTIYGLPDQEAPKAGAKTDAPPRSIHRSKRKAKRASGAGGGVSAKRAVKAKRGTFRPALTAEGTIICMGAEYGELELDKPTTRVLLDVARKLNPAELGAVVEFLELLDAGEVAA